MVTGVPPDPTPFSLTPPLAGQFLHDMPDPTVGMKGIMIVA